MVRWGNRAESAQRLSQKGRCSPRGMGIGEAATIGFLTPQGSPIPRLGHPVLRHHPQAGQRFYAYLTLLNFAGKRGEALDPRGGKIDDIIQGNGHQAAAPQLLRKDERFGRTLSRQFENLPARQLRLLGGVVGVIYANSVASSLRDWLAGFCIRLGLPPLFQLRLELDVWYPC